MVELFEGIRPASRRVHENLRAYVLLEAGELDVAELKHEGGETVNHRQGWQAVGLLQVRRAVEGRGRPEHARALDRVVEHVVGSVDQELRQGLCLGEVLSTTYRPFSELFRGLAWREGLRLLALRPEDGGVRKLLGSLRTWFRVDRHLIQLCQAGDGLNHHPGIRAKFLPEEMPGPNVLAHRWHRPVTQGRMRRLLDRAGDSFWREHRPMELCLWRLCDTPEGQRLEEASRDTVPGRLATDIGAHSSPAGHLVVRMPKVVVIHESRNLPPQVIWEVETDRRGRLVRRVREQERRVSPGETMRHPEPEGRRIPAGWTVMGPATPVPESPPWAGPPPAIDEEETVPPTPRTPEASPRDIDPASLTAAEARELTGPQLRVLLQAMAVAAQDRDPHPRIAKAWARIAPAILAQRGSGGT